LLPPRAPDMLTVRIGQLTVWGLSPHQIRSLVGCSPNASLQLLPTAGATKERTLEAVRFRVKAPVPRRPPHRSGREGVPPPVPQEPKACANGEPSRRHPAWRITVLSRPLLEVGNDPGLRQRQLARDGRHTLLPASGARVAASAPPVAPRPLGLRADHVEPLAMATHTLVWVRATPCQT